jgi:N-acetyl-alpha-D-muramate 1-phosphate uridylyltransferase
MILAAGRGERMRPLTDVNPKPLLVVRGKPLIDWHLEKLAAAGFSQVVINVSHLADRIVAHVGTGARYGLTVYFSHEPEALESGGGVAWAAPLLRAGGDGPFALISADVFSEMDYASLVPQATALTHHAAHLWLVVPKPNQPGREFSLRDGQVHIDSENALTWASIAVLHSSYLENMPRGQKFKLMPYFQNWIAQGRMSGEIFSGAWENVTSAEDIVRLNTTAASA